MNLGPSMNTMGTGSSSGNRAPPLDLVFSAGGLLTKRMLEKLFISRIREEDVQGLARWHDITPESLRAPVRFPKFSSRYHSGRDWKVG